MRVLIAGAGAVGGYFGAVAARGGAGVRLLARGAHAAAMRDRGVAIRSWREGLFVAHPAVVTTVAEAAARGPFELVIVAVKSLALAELARELGAAAPRLL